MGSSGESNTNGIDASVGGLVWVRRRNGSWWPGRIMGLDELSEGCLVSPRSGTPVKLLGRDDASVDWYNLEKSKRVKAFRCGEYNECIEKAKAAAANSNKKTVKYARREDAILHALEIESSRLGKEPLKFYSRADKSTSEHGDSAGASPDSSNSGDDNEDVADGLSDSENNSNSVPELSQSGISFEEPNHNSSSKMLSVQGRRKTPNDSEDDGTEGVKRMRGLEDLGIGVASKRKVQGAGTTVVFQQHSSSPSNLNTGNCLANGTSVNGVKTSSSMLKRKRTQVATVHEFLKRKNRRRPLTKVLESTAMVSVPVVCNQLPTSSSSPLCGIPDSRISALDFNESKKSSPLVTHNMDGTKVECEKGTSLNALEHGNDASQMSHNVKENDASGIAGLVGTDSSDKLFDVPFVGVLGEERHTPGKPQVARFGQQSCPVGQSEALLKEGQNESGPTSSAAGHNTIGNRVEKSSSKWQSKRKRNSRRRSKNRKQGSRKFVDMDNEPTAYLAGLEKPDGFSRVTGPKAELNVLSVPAASYNCLSQAKCKPAAESHLDSFHDVSKHMWGITTGTKLVPDGSVVTQRLLPYRQSRFTVNSRYQTVDFPGRNYFSDASLYEVKLEVKASYRPQHVPLVSLMSKLNGKAIVGHPLTVETLADGHCDELLSSIRCDSEAGDIYCAVKPNSATGTIHSKNSPRFSPGKSSRSKKSGLLSKKIRKLSSLTGHKQLDEDRKPVVDKPKGPVIACIPLKVVFSRINEAVNGQARPAYRILPTSNP
ncbi:uncharacterized protein At1g51745-like [Prosopis cineraria]|uniref:uncharacterized protein At1g51745-like n=1 Tax=Prosopis cineraria TaxID=364024 RepID=UPI00240F38D5|nr:uncharacterized protein At1g51745-like [Prosopis cineraria]XP_054781035.1 uncharacterized protein At1g51745-like [Prosopis cineraria]XP_054781036.1 uncharacterized protein At1g51745-like [Prosopis cineraria]